VKIDQDGVVRFQVNATHGIVPRRANGPGSFLVPHHSAMISAKRRALSRLPDARRRGSARSKAPSTDE
jgi:hypothetical protein